MNILNILKVIKHPLRCYKQLHRRKQLVVQAATAVTFWQIVANVIYFWFPSWFTFTLIEWNGVAFGMITSVAAVYYALYGIWHSYGLVDKARDEMLSRLGVPFIKNLAEFGKKLDKRWAELSPEQRAIILNKTDTMVDRIFSSLGKEMPKPERKKVKAMK